jgi:AhpD family alkylhydroperoxidase
VRRIYDAIEPQTGRVSSFFRMLGNKPGLLRAFNQLHGVVWAEGAPGAKLKELAYLRVSIMNGCAYSTRAHAASGKRRGLSGEQIAVLKEPRRRPPGGPVR